MNSNNVIKTLNNAKDLLNLEKSISTEYLEKMSADNEGVGVIHIKKPGKFSRDAQEKD